MAKQPCQAPQRNAGVIPKDSPHTGGERFTTNCPLYTTLLRWLQAGAPKDATNVAKVVALELMPMQAVLEGQGASQKLTARARYSDGSDRDVTSLAVFSSNNELSAKVSDTGVITAGQRGEAFVMSDGYGLSS